MQTCKYCGYGNPDNTGECYKCGAPQREAFARLEGIEPKFLSKLVESNYLMGIDVSHWDGHIDWQTASQHTNFCLIKCTEGTTFYDDTYAANKQGCVQYNVPHGAYHFFRSNTDPLAQASHFVSHVNDQDLQVYVVDVESNNGGNIITTLRTLLDRLEALTGHLPFIYTAYYFWKDNFGSAPWASKYPLWVANYGVVAPLIPSPWTDWTLWQYSSSGSIPGIPAKVDLNNFDGTREEVQDLFKNGIAPPPPPPNKIYFPMICKVNALNVRKGPSTSFPIVGVLRKDDVVDIRDVGGAKDVWIQIKDGPFAGYWTCASYYNTEYMEPTNEK